MTCATYNEVSEQNLVEIDVGLTAVSLIVVMWKHDSIHETGSTQTIAVPSEWTNPQQQLTWTGNFVKFVRVVFKMSERTDRQTDIHNYTFSTSHLSRGQSKSFQIVAQSGIFCPGCPKLYYVHGFQHAQAVNAAIRGYPLRSIAYFLIRFMRI